MRVTGFVNQSQLPRYYDLCDVFVLPSERDRWGLAVNEVMNAGKAVIVTDQVGCAPDLIREGENGFVVPVGDAPSLASSMLRLVARWRLCALVWARRLADWLQTSASNKISGASSKHSTRCVEAARASSGHPTSPGMLLRAPSDKSSVGSRVKT